MPNVRILIVDDNNDFSVLLSAFLSAVPGFEIVGIASDGLCAVEKIHETKPDVVLLDIVMPEADGLEVLRQIKLTGKNNPFVIVLSAMGMKEIYQQALSLGANRYYLKPVQMESIIKTIQEVFEKTASLKEKATKLVHYMKIPPYIQGFRYLRDLLVLYSTDNSQEVNSLCQIIADSYKVKYEMFLRSIYYAIKIAWDQDDGRNNDSLFYSYRKENARKPTLHRLLQMANLKLKEY